MDFSTLAHKLSVLEQTASRLEMTRHLAELFGQLDHDEIPAACYLMQGSLVPEYQRLEFQLSDKMVVRALEQISGEETELMQRYKQVGDIGVLAQEVLETLEENLQQGQNQSISHNQELAILDVFGLLTQIAVESGQGSQQRKLDLLSALLNKVSPLSARFIARIVVGRLRLGFSTMTMIDALSWSAHQNKSDSEELEAAFNRKADIGVLAQHYLQNGNASVLKEITVTLGIPVMPALCQRLNSAAEIIEKMGTVFAEPKYDGLRIQIHIDRTAQKITAHTRNLDDVSHMFPELNTAYSAIVADSVILDGEAIGYDPATDSLRAFQETSTRRRKHDVGSQSEKIPMRFYIYDLLFLNSKSLIDMPLQERKELLGKLITENEVFFPTPYIQTSDPIELRTFHEEQLAAGFEGAVIKKIDSPYISGRKGWSWVKIKEEEGTTGKLADTVDCVVMGYYLGRGKRTQFGLGALLVGVRDAATDSYKTVAKIGTGVTEQQLVELKKLCDSHLLLQVPAVYDIPKALLPDVIVEPSIVIEIAADEVTQSPLHTAKQALRFPRLITIRTDKNPQEATTTSELEQLKQLQ